MHQIPRNISLAALLGAALAMGGCATTEDVAKAQASADQAHSAAQAAQESANSANQRAETAMAAAQAAQQSANQAHADLTSLTTTTQGLRQDVDTHMKRTAQRG